jgi:hypothetical protein
MRSGDGYLKTKSDSTNGRIREITQKQGYAMLNKQTMQFLNMSAKDFISAWRAGKFRDSQEDPQIARLAALIPLAT